MKRKIDLNIKAEELKKKLNIKDGVDGVTPDITSIVKDIKESLPTPKEVSESITASGEAVRDSLELLSGEDRLDREYIRGLDDYEKISELARNPDIDLKKLKVFGGGGSGLGFTMGDPVTSGTYNSVLFLDASPEAYAGYAEFDGTNSYFTFPSITLTGDYEIEMDVYFDTIGTDNVMVGRSSSNGRFEITSTAIFVVDDGGTAAFNSSHGLSAGTWYNIKATRVGSTVTYYADDVSIGTGTHSGNVTLDTVGDHPTVANSELDGRIKNLVITDTSSGVLAQFALDTGDLLDDSGNDNHGTNSGVTFPITGTQTFISEDNVNFNYDDDTDRLSVKHLDVSGSIRTNWENVDTNTVLTDQNAHLILVDTQTPAADVIITLPLSTDNDGLEFHIKKYIGASNDVVRVRTTGGDTIDGQSEQAITTLYNSLFVKAANGDWHII